MKKGKENNTECKHDIWSLLTRSIYIERDTERKHDNWSLLTRSIRNANVIFRVY